MSASKFPRRHPETSFREIAGEGLVVQSDRAMVQVLNPVAVKVYSLLDGRHSEDDIVRAVVEEFEVSETEARKDVRDFLAELHEQGMIVAEAEA